MTLIKVYFLVAMFFSPIGDVKDAVTHGVFKTAQECQYRREAIIIEPPPGLPPNVGLACVEVETNVRNVGA